MNSFKSGIKYEQHVKQVFRRFGLKTVESTGGCKKRPDVSIIIGERRINFECKTKRAFEGGACGFDIVDGFLVNRNLFFTHLIGNHVPWGGKIPSFKLGNKDFDVWTNEKHLFRDEYIIVSPDSISRYYRDNDVHYILIQNIGYFHTGDDVLGLKCNQFKPNTRLRIRCKQHSGSSLPSSIQASLVFKIT